MDYKLIALFHKGLVYLESGRHTWLWLIINSVEEIFMSDAIVHDGIVYAVDTRLAAYTGGVYRRIIVLSHLIFTL